MSKLKNPTNKSRQCKVSNNLPAAGCSFECVVLASGRLLLELVSGGERGGGWGGGDTRGAGGGSASEEMSIMSMLVQREERGDYNIILKCNKAT